MEHNTLQLQSTPTSTTYTVTVENAAGCTDTDDVQVPSILYLQPHPLQAMQHQIVMPQMRRIQ